MIIDLNPVPVFLAVAEEGGEIVGHPQAAFASVATTLIDECEQEATPVGTASSLEMRRFSQFCV